MKRARRMSNTSFRCAAARSPLIAHTGWRISPSARRAGPAGLPAGRTAAAATAMHARSEQSFRTIHPEEKNAPAIARAAKRTETTAPSFKARSGAIRRSPPLWAARRRGTYAASKDLSPARGGNLNPPKPRPLRSWCRQVDIGSPRVNACDDTCGRDDCPHAQCAPPFHGSAEPASVGRYGSVFRYHERHMSFVQARRRRRSESPLPFVCEQAPGSRSNHARGTIVTGSVEKTLCRYDGRGAVANVERAEDSEQMHLDRTFGDAQLTCDRLVRLAACKEPHDLQLAFG